MVPAAVATATGANDALGFSSSNETQSRNSASKAGLLIQLRLWPGCCFLAFTNGQTHSTDERRYRSCARMAGTRLSDSPLANWRNKQALASLEMISEVGQTANDDVAKFNSAKLRQSVFRPPHRWSAMLTLQPRRKPVCRRRV